MSARLGLALASSGLAAALLWLALGTAAELPELRPGEQGWSGDYRSFHLPNAEYAAERLRAGEIPLWNPHQAAGGPFLATLQAGVLYPPNALRLALPAHRAALLLAFAHQWLAAVLAGALAAALGAGPAGAALAGLLYASSLSVVGDIWSPMAHYAAAWAPGVWLALDRCLVRPAPRCAAALAVAFAMPLLAGWPQIAAMLAVGGALYAGPLLLLRLRRSPRGAGQGLLAAGLGAGGGLLLAAPQLLPALELVPRSCRAFGSLVEAQAIFVSAPHDPTRFWESFWSHGFSDGIPGALALALAPLALLRPGPGRGRLAALLAVGGLALLASFPEHAPVYGWLRRLPLLSDFRFPYRWRLLTALALCAAAGVGATALRERLSRWPRLARLVAPAALGLAVATQSLPVYRSVLPFARALPPEVPLAQWLAESGVEEPPPADLGRVYRAGLARKLRERRDTYTVHDLEPLTLARTAQLLTWFETGRARTLLTLPEPPRAPGARRPDTVSAPFYGHLVLPPRGERAFVLDLFSAELIAGEDAPGWLDARYRRLSAPGARLAVFRNPHALPRAYAVARALREPADAQRALQRMAARDFDPGAVVLLDAPPAELLARPGAPPPPFRGRVDVERYEPERVVLRSRSAQPALVVLTDAHYPGWEARVDGAPAPLLRANLAFRAVAVGPGEHEIEMRYRPASFRLGVGLALLALGACVLAGRGRRRSAGARGPPG